MESLLNLLRPMEMTSFRNKNTSTRWALRSLWIANESMAEVDHCSRWISDSLLLLFPCSRHHQNSTMCHKSISRWESKLRYSYVRTSGFIEISAISVCPFDDLCRTGRADANAYRAHSNTKPNPATPVCLHPNVHQREGASRLFLLLLGWALDLCRSSEGLLSVLALLA